MEAMKLVLQVMEHLEHAECREQDVVLVYIIDFLKDSEDPDEIGVGLLMNLVRGRLSAYQAATGRVKAPALSVLLLRTPRPPHLKTVLPLFTWRAPREIRTLSMLQGRRHRFAG